MISAPRLPDLRLKGKEAYWANLVRYLYKGGVDIPWNKSVLSNISDGSYGEPSMIRLPLIIRIKNYLEVRADEGTHEKTIYIYMHRIRGFYSFHDKKGIDITVDSLAECYISYAAKLHVEYKCSSNAETKVRRQTSTLGTIFGAILEDESLVTRAIERQHEEDSTALEVQSSMHELPDLRVEGVEGIVWDLTRYVYVGGSTTHATRYLKSLIGSGLLGEPLMERVPLLVKIKEHLEDELAGGLSESTVRTSLNLLKLFYKYNEAKSTRVTLDDLEMCFMEYALYLNTLSKQGATKVLQAQHIINRLGRMFGAILGLGTLADRVIVPKYKPGNPSLEKQDLEELFRTGTFLSDVARGLTSKNITGPLPVRIPITPGVISADQIEMYVGRTTDYSPVDHLSKRPSLVNKRIAVEFLIFVAHTGMNVSEAISICRDKLKYKRLGDLWQISAYKRRKGGVVLFEVEGDYKKPLKKYINFIDECFPNSDLLFPTYGEDGGITPNHYRKTLCEFLEGHGITYISPNRLRLARQNWFYRRSGDDELTSEVGQHSKETFHNVYKKPHYQKTIVQITKYWKKHEAGPVAELNTSVIDATCCGQPVPTDDIPGNVNMPDCLHASGCLYCECRRDPDTSDYVWNLVTFKFLKNIEASGYRKQVTGPAEEDVKRLAAMIQEYRKIFGRKMWVSEAEERISEGEYHPNYSRVLLSLGY